LLPPFLPICSRHKSERSRLPSGRVGGQSLPRWPAWTTKGCKQLKMVNKEKAGRIRPAIRRLEVMQSDYH